MPEITLYLMIITIIIIIIITIKLWDSQLGSLKLDSNLFCKKVQLCGTQRQTLFSPGEAPPGTRQRAEDHSEGQSRKERVKGEVEQSLHPIIAQAFEWVNIVLRKWKKKKTSINQSVNQKIKKHWLNNQRFLLLCCYLIKTSAVE